uniref:Putative secreted peptide n=1 Tax=Ornithodoros turicata TaxID=34597 RepID=A0A2R5LCW0_9ACAR
MFTSGLLVAALGCLVSGQQTDTPKAPDNCPTDSSPCNCKQTVDSSGCPSCVCHDDVPATACPTMQCDVTSDQCSITPDKDGCQVCQCTGHHTGGNQQQSTAGSTTDADLG